MEVVGGGSLRLVADAGMVVRWTRRRYTGNISISRKKDDATRRLTRGRPKGDEAGRTQYAPPRVMVSLWYRYT
jgi:hypothetical protein